MVMSCNKGGRSYTGVPDCTSSAQEEGHRQEAAGDIPPPPEHQPTLSGKQGLLKVQGAVHLLREGGEEHRPHSWLEGNVPVEVRWKGFFSTSTLMFLKETGVVTAARPSGLAEDQRSLASGCVSGGSVRANSSDHELALVDGMFCFNMFSGKDLTSTSIR
ncbi:unnamed protein product [Boreogadus saida]